MSGLDFLYMVPKAGPYEFHIGPSTARSDQGGKGLSIIAKAHFVKGRENEGKKHKKMDRNLRRENDRRGGKRRWKEKKSSSYNIFQYAYGRMEYSLVKA